MATGLLIHLWRLVAPEFDRVAWEHIVVHAEERLATLDPSRAAMVGPPRAQPADSDRLNPPSRGAAGRD
jgi:hypothetical protein